MEFVVVGGQCRNGDLSRGDHSGSCHSGSHDKKGRLQSGVARTRGGTLFAPLSPCSLNKHQLLGYEQKQEVRLTRQQTGSKSLTKKSVHLGVAMQQAGERLEFAECAIPIFFFFLNAGRSQSKSPEAYKQN